MEARRLARGRADRRERLGSRDPALDAEGRRRVAAKELREAEAEAHGRKLWLRAVAPSRGSQDDRPTLTFFVDNANVVGWINGVMSAEAASQGTRDALTYFGRLAEQLFLEGARPHHHDLVLWMPRSGNGLADELTHLASPGVPHRWLHH